MIEDKGDNDGTGTAAGSGQLTSAVISLPKGGRGIRGIGEKFAANPVTGAASLTMPITTSPGHSGFAPQLSLAYDSGAGNGPFDIGWSLSLPSITPKTDRGLLRYRDAEESDVFILSSAEDLVLVQDGENREKLPAHGGRATLPSPARPPAHRRTVRPYRVLDQ